MERLVKIRKPVRMQVTKLINEVRNLCAVNPVDKGAIQTYLELLERKYIKLEEHDEAIMKQAVEDDFNDDAIEKECDECNAYSKRYLDTVREAKQKILEGRAQSQPVGVEIRQGYKLPKIELSKFSGKLTDWLGFWAQFKKIHENVNLSNSDKFSYLIQSLVKGTEAYDIISVFPQSEENYEKAVETLQKRYGNLDMLLNVYVRELLSLVIGNAIAKDKMGLQDLYYKVRSHLGSLKTLELERAGPDAWLYPLVESALPEDTLFAWQRSTEYGRDGNRDDPPKTRLDFLLEFMEREVTICQNVEIAKGGFVIGKKETKKTSKKNDIKNEDLPTVAGLHSGECEECIFCGKKNHASQDCFSAQKKSNEEKTRIVQEKQVCFRCLRKKHRAKDCKAQLRCIICGGSHYPIMCRQHNSIQKGSEPTVISTEANGSQSKNLTRTRDSPQHQSILDNDNKITNGKPDGQIGDNTKNYAGCASAVCSRQVALQTMMVRIITNRGSKTVRAFLDSGSQHSYILERTVRELGLRPIGQETVSHALFGGSCTAATIHQIYNITLGAMKENLKIIVTVRDQQKISQGISRFSSKNTKIWEELREKEIKVTDIGEDCPEIEILIGANVYGKILTGKTVQLDSGLTAIQTELGWTLIGKIEEEKRDAASMMVTTMTAQQVSISQLWDLDTIGIRDPVDVKTAAEEVEDIKTKFFEEITREQDGRYVVPLPWKDGHLPLLSNREAALKRLHRTTKKLQEEKNYKDYDRVLKDWEQEGFIRNMEDKEVSCGIKCHYLPHRPVYKDSATTPVRPVFDASCKAGKHPSLNDCLETGTNCVQLIPELILQFREGAVGFTSDIRKAFQMIGVRKEDQDSLRFFWWNEDGQLRELAHTRVLFGATCSPFILGAVLEYHLARVNKEEKEFAKRLLNSLYVDNCIGSVNTEEEYQTFKGKATQLLKDARMDLRLWMSNRDENVENSEKIISVLGIKWNREEDVMLVDTGSIPVPDEITKRSVLSTIQKVFDPIGILCPAMIPMKILLQRAWVNKLKWDELLSKEEGEEFKKWCTNINILSTIKIPRLATAGIRDRSKWSLHLFTDASKDAYAAVVYLRVETTKGIKVQLLEAKARVAPVKKEVTKKNKRTGVVETSMKEVSIPRLELLGCFIGSRLLATVRRALSVENVATYCWTDSSTAIVWIRTEKPLAVFVENRVKEIRELTDKENWRHVPGSMNPADLPSRGCTPLQLLQSKWWEGPEWLYLTEEEWPHSQPKTDTVEVDKEFKKLTTVAISMVVHEEVRYDHTYSQYVRIVGWVLRFVKNVRKEKLIGKLSSKELEEAEKVIIRGIQKEAFCNDESYSNKDVQLGEDSILRVRTRLTFRDDLEEFKKPILLPRRHPLVRKLIEEYHRKCCHAGVTFLMTKLRENYWILQSRLAIGSVIRRCFTCRRLTARPIVTEEAPLPKERITEADVFEVVGVDLAGPLYVKNHKKVWIVIFTCGVYRAVHLDLVVSLSTQAFIRSLERFVKRYGRPTVIYSDNGTNFVGTNNLFKTIDWHKVQQDDGVQRIQWKFNPPFAAWWGGWWERLIRTMKDLLKRTLGRATLTKEQLAKMLEKVEEVMNGRPITYVSDTPGEPQPLTPAMFLRHKANIKFPEAEMTEGEHLRFRYAWRESLKKELQNRFRNEYLSQLINKAKMKPSRPLQVGDVVVVGSDLKKRVDWPLGRISELYPGKDGIRRVAKLKTRDGIIIRPVQRLCPLELDVKATTEILTTRAGRRIRTPDRLRL